MWGSRKTKRQCVDLRHERAMDIDDDAVEATGRPLEWQVRSSAGDDFYTVQQNATGCPGPCRETNRCFASGCNGLCGHMYWCSCPDENTLCKHIHKVRILSHRSTQSEGQQASTARADDRWRTEVNVERQVKRIRRILKDIDHSLDRYDADALSGIIDEVAEDLQNIDAKLSSHCDDFENGEDDDSYSDDDEDDD